jgi:hypothetical protein
MIVNRTFHHGHVDYPFNWAKKRFETGPIPRAFYHKLDKYYSRIMDGDIPHQLFNDPSTIRCSSFKLKGLPRGTIKTLSLQLIRAGMIEILSNEKSKIYHPNLVQLPAMVQNVYEIFAKENMPKPDHNPILKRILITNNNALSTETPIWSTLNDISGKQKTLFDTMACKQSKPCSPFTGHIDLLLFDESDDSLVVADYKPEREYLKTIPQVAFYGLYMKKMLQIPKVKCISFSKEDAWLYDPDIIINELPRLLDQYYNTKPEWRILSESL